MRSFTIVSSRSLARYNRIFSLFFSLPGFTILIAFILLGHILAYTGWSILLYSWDFSRVPAFSGLIYLLLLVVSVLLHEAGHVVVALHKGDLSARAYIQFNSLSPMFAANRKIDRKEYPPVFYLAGIIMQLLFTGLLGVLFFLTHFYALPAAVVLIDLGALSSLILLKGSDGSNFVKGTIRRQFTSNGRSIDSTPNSGLHTNSSADPLVQLPITLLTLILFTVCITLFYTLSSSLLLFEIIYQWLIGATKNIFAVYLLPFHLLQFIIIISPALMYLILGIKSIGVMVQFLKTYSIEVKRV